MTNCYPFRSEQARNEYLALYDQQAQAWPVASETRTVETVHGKTFVRISGSPDASPLILLPGNGGNALMWLPNIAAWSAYYRTYALDSIYDFGRSVAKRPINKVPDLIQWLDDVLTALDLKKDINLLGMSLGGWLAGQYAVRHSCRLRKLVWLAPAGTLLPVSWQWLIRMLPILIPHRFFFEQFIDWISPDLRRTPEGRATVERMVDEFQMTRRCFRRMPIIPPTVLTDVELARIAVPVLFVVGEHEKIYSATKAVERLRRVAPQIQTEILPEAGHDLLITQTEEVNRRVLAFLA